jgi:hypothetical protein
MHTAQKLFVPVLAAALLTLACGGGQQTIPGTQVPDSDENRAIIDTVEKYRVAIERRDAAALLLMASPDYWEDGGTGSGSDDYGYKGLQRVLAGRFQQVEGIRYSLRYLRIRSRQVKRRSGDVVRRAFVDVLIDASFSVKDGRGEMVRHDMRDQNQLVLQWDGEQWKFLSGM